MTSLSFNFTPGGSVPGQARPGFTGFQVAGSFASSGKWLWYSAVPGMTIPGAGNPGRDGTGGYPAQKYLGHYPVYFLDFIDLTLARTLLAIPGEWYSAHAASARGGITALSGDRWAPSSIVSLFAVHGPALHEGRAHNAALQARFMQSPEGAPRQLSLAEFARLPARKEEPKPLSEASKALIAARVLNAELQARGGKPDGD